ncbi:MAG: endonuclease III [Candidatus Omnitrophica bacterium]|nr:endonuclease III [Candidatus Omnitrophota bacterium]
METKLKTKVIKTIRLIEEQLKPFHISWLKNTQIHEDPYKILISCLLSLRTKDPVTYEATKRLFKVADNPFKMVKIPISKIQNLIYPVGFYRQKAKFIKELSKQLIERYKGNVPSSLNELLRLKGVGLKTANLVLGRGFGIPAICVDTHVHRISNRLGWVKTKDPKETEKFLRKIIPKDYWIRINSLMVVFGQKICLAVSPLCSRCKLKNICKRKGLTYFR